MRGVLSAATVCRQWHCRTDHDSSVNKYVVEVSGGMEKVGLRAKALHQTGHWLVLFDGSNAFNSVKRAEILKEILHRVPTRTYFVVKFDGGRT